MARIDWRKLLPTGKPRAVPKVARARLTLMAKWRGLDEIAIESLREVAEVGRRFEALSSHPDWPALLELKEELQAIATEQTRAPSSTDAQRREGAAAYWALEGFFGTCYRTMRNGRKAGELLKESVRPTS